MPDLMLRTSAGGAGFFATAALFTRWDSLPYGMWSCADGREVLFNRFYEPIRQRRPECAPDSANPHERVNFDHQVWFYDDTDTEPQKQALAEEALLWFISRRPLAAGSHSEAETLTGSLRRVKAGLRCARSLYGKRLSK